MYKAKAIAATAVNVIELVDIELPELKPGEHMIRTEFTAVSPGTELRCLAGLQRGNMAFPFIPGNSLVGIVESVCGDSPVSVGTRVFAAGTSHASINLQWGGHVSAAIAGSHRVVPIPDGCTPKWATLSKLAAIPLRGCRIAEPKRSDMVAVVGLGPIGLLSLRHFRAAGANVVGVDQDASRVDRAKKDGVAAVAVTTTIEEAVYTYFGQGADIVVDATGVPAVLPLSIRAARELPWNENDLFGPKVLIQGSYPDPFTLFYSDCFLKELRILTPRDCTPANLVEAVGMIADGTIRVDDLISWSGDPASAPEVYARLRTDRDMMTAVFEWSG